MPMQRHSTLRGTGLISLFLEDSSLLLGKAFSINPVDELQVQELNRPEHRQVLLFHMLETRM
jgi:hypothetical protein